MKLDWFDDIDNNIEKYENLSSIIPVEKYIIYKKPVDDVEYTINIDEEYLKSKIKEVLQDE